MANKWIELNWIGCTTVFKTAVLSRWTYWVICTSLPSLYYLNSACRLFQPYANPWACPQSLSLRRHCLSGSLTRWYTAIICTWPQEPASFFRLPSLDDGNRIRVDFSIQCQLGGRILSNQCPFWGSCCLDSQAVKALNKEARSNMKYIQWYLRFSWTVTWMMNNDYHNKVPTSATF